MKDFYHTGLQVSRSDLAAIKSPNSFRKLYVMPAYGQNPPVPGVYQSGSDENDGLTWDTAFATIAKAITISNNYINWSATPWAPNTEIHIAPGKYAENLTAMPYGASLIGHGDAFDADGERSVRIKPASGSAISVTSIINSLIYNLNIQVADASDIISVTNFNNNQMIHCSLQGPPEATTALRGMNLTDAVSNLWRDCQFFYMDCGLDWTSGGGPTSVRNWIDRNMFSYISEAGIRFHSTTVAPITHITENSIDGGSGTLAIGIDINMGTPTISCYRNNISATDGIEGDTTGNFIGGNYCNGVLE